MAPREPLPIRAFDEEGLSLLNNILQELFRLGVLRLDVPTNDGGRLIVGNFGDANTPQYGMQMRDVNGNVLSQVTASGLAVNGPSLGNTPLIFSAAGLQIAHASTGVGASGVTSLTISGMNSFSIVGGSTG